MIIEIKEKALIQNLIKQIENLFGISNKEINIITKFFSKSLQRTEYCFSRTKNKYYHRNGKVYFNPYHSGQYCIFLYFFSNTIFNKLGNNLLSDKIYYLNKTLNGLDLFYEVKMPKIFILDHPVGTVIGKASIKSFFSFSSNCVVGNNKGIFPRLGSNVYLSTGSTILGDCTIGNNVIFAANSYILDKDISSNSIVYGRHPNIEVKKITSEEIYTVLKLQNYKS
jgi:serine O-acetyltransferase